jgi:hypothetical protein
MIVAGGTCCDTDDALRESVIGSLGEVVASLAQIASSELSDLADHLEKGVPMAPLN